MLNDQPHLTFSTVLDRLHWTLISMSRARCMLSTDSINRSQAATTSLPVLVQLHVVKRNEVWTR